MASIRRGQWLRSARKVAPFPRHRPEWVRFAAELASIRRPALPIMGSFPTRDGFDPDSANGFDPYLGWLRSSQMGTFPHPGRARVDGFRPGGSRKYVIPAMLIRGTSIRDGP